MKNIKKWSVLFLVCMISVMAFQMHVFAKVSPEVVAAANQKYQAFKNTHKLASSVIVDIDRNGIPEFLCFDKGDMKAKAYTYNKKTRKMVKLCSVNSGKGYGSYYSVRKHQVVLFSNDTGGARYHVYKVSGTKAKKVTTYTSQRKYPGFTYTYKIGKRKVNETKWRRAVNDIQKYAYFRGLMG